MRVIISTHCPKQTFTWGSPPPRSKKSFPLLRLRQPRIHPDLFRQASFLFALAPFFFFLPRNLASNCFFLYGSTFRSLMLYCGRHIAISCGTPDRALMGSTMSSISHLFSGPYVGYFHQLVSPCARVSTNMRL